MNRRDFLNLSSKIFISSAFSNLQNLLLPNVAKADRGSDPHMFLVIRIWNSMDTTIGLNPWTAEPISGNNLFLDDNYEVFTSPRAPQIKLGPGAKPLLPHIEDLSIINGIFMGTVDLGHPAAQNYITTAKDSPDAPHFIAELADHCRYRDAKELESLLFNSSLNTFDLEKIEKIPFSALSTVLEYDNKLQFNSMPILSTRNSSFKEADTQIEMTQDERREMYKIIKSISSASETQYPNNGNKKLSEEAMVAAAFSSQSTRFAQLDYSEFDLDNHTGFAKNHLESQTKAWSKVSEIIEILKNTPLASTGEALFPNYVTLAVLTEFSRLPFLNENQGKDHNFFDNSIILGGKGVKGGQVVGDHHLFVKDNKRSESQLSGCHIDYSTGEVVKNDYYNTYEVEKVIENSQVNLIRPENVLKTMGEIFSVDHSRIRLYKEDVLPLPGLVKV